MTAPVTPAGKGMVALRKLLRWADGKRIKPDQWAEMVQAIEQDAAQEEQDEATELLKALSHLIGGAEVVMIDPMNTDWDRQKFQTGLRHARTAKREYLARRVGQSAEAPDREAGDGETFRADVAAVEGDLECGEPLPPEHWSSAMPPCRRKKGHHGLHWFVPDTAYAEAIKEKN